MYAVGRVSRRAENTEEEKEQKEKEKEKDTSANKSGKERGKGMYKQRIRRGAELLAFTGRVDRL